ncbi:hypothetical protein BDR22DRAFT_959119 [Usnea florida]
MPSIQHLSAELICEEEHPAPTLKAVSLVCRLFYETSLALLFRYVNIPLTAKDPKQAAAFLQVLHKEPRIRSHIQHITVPVPKYGFHGRHSDLEESFKSLLPLLPQLQAVRIGGDECFNYDWIDLRPVDPSILSAINELHRSVSLAVDCYVYTRNIDARLDKLACLDSLRVCFLGKTTTNRIGGWANEELGSNPFLDILMIISTNTRLKHLHLSLQRGYGVAVPPVYSEMEQYALEVLGPTIPDLKSVVLEGDLHFTDKALRIWTKSFNKLRSLYIMGVPLIEEMTKSLQGQMPALQTLKLSAFKDLQEKTTFQGDTGSVKAFLSTLTLSSLSLLGFPPDILLHAIRFSCPSLIHLCFHIREDAMALCMRSGPPLSTLLLSTAHLETINCMCPALQSLTLDVTRSNLLTAGRPPRESPSPDLRPSPIAAFATPTTPADHSLLFALATMPNLQHIRLYLHIDPVDGTLLNNPPLIAADVLATYAYLRGHKCARPLKSLLVCAAQERFEVWESGPDRVVTVECSDGRNGRVREAWDIDEWVMRGREELTQERGYTLRPVWGVIKG